MWCWLNWIIFLIGSKESWTYLATSLWSTIKLLWDLAWVVTSLGLSVFICKFMTMKQKSSMSHSNSDIRWIKKRQIFTTASYDTFWDIKLCFLLHFLFLPFPLQAWVQEGFASGLRTWEEEELVWTTADQESDAPTQAPDALILPTFGRRFVLLYENGGEGKSLTNRVCSCATRHKWKQILVEETETTAWIVCPLHLLCKTSSLTLFFLVSGGCFGVLQRQSVLNDTIKEIWHFFGRIKCWRLNCVPPNSYVEVKLPVWLYLRIGSKRRWCRFNEIIGWGPNGIGLVP